MNEFITIIEDGVYYPARFIARNNEAGQIAKDNYKLSGNEEFIIVELSEIKN